MLVRADAPQATCVFLKLGARSLAPCGVRETLVKLPAPGRHQIRLETADAPCWRNPLSKFAACRVELRHRRSPAERQR
jgi:hypothetical protein